MQAESIIQSIKSKAERDKFYELKVFEMEMESSLPQPLRQEA